MSKSRGKCLPALASKVEVNPYRCAASFKNTSAGVSIQQNNIIFCQRAFTNIDRLTTLYYALPVAAAFFRCADAFDEVTGATRYTLSFAFLKIWFAASDINL